MENIFPTNPPQTLILDDNDYYTYSSISVPGEYLCLNNDIEQVWVNPIYPQFFSK